jgi:hypothetical protein
MLKGASRRLTTIREAQSAVLRVRKEIESVCAGRKRIDFHSSTDVKPRPLETE